MEFLEKLGIDWKIIFSQIINLLIILYLLNIFAFKPFLKILKERERKIKEGIEKSQRAKELLENLQKEKNKIFEKAKEKGEKILLYYQKRAEKEKEKILAQANREREDILKKARKLGEKEISQMKSEFLKKNLEIVFKMTEKILKEKITPKKDEKICKEFLKKLENYEG